MPKYGVSFGSFSTTTSVLTALKLVTASVKSYEIVEFAMYGGGIVAAADIQHQATGAFVSAVGAGTGTASPPTPEPFDQRSAASGNSILWKMTAEPTTYDTVFPVLIGFNQRGGMRWAVPQGEGLGAAFENASMHFGWRVQSSAVGTVDGHMHWWER